MADAAGVALSLTYYLTLLVKALPVAKDKEAPGVLLILLIVFVVLAGMLAIFAMKQQTETGSGSEQELSQGRQVRAVTNVEMQSGVVLNPAYEVCGRRRRWGLQRWRDWC
jgi:hypothetical protein